jgi:hypothetical protein
MNKSLNTILITLIVCSFSTIVKAQKKEEKIWFSGFARSYYARDVHENKGDTLYPRNSSNGYNLVDLNTHVNPIDNIEIFAQLRVRNQFGSFFGSGTNIDVRQLRASGTINNKFNFSIGDVFLKQNRFTLYNYNEELSSFENDMFKSYRDIIHYENFYTENRWRLQGLQTDFSFEFDRFIRTLEFDFFITRPRGSSQISSIVYSPDLLLSGGSMISKISKNLSFEINYINFFEVPNSGNINMSVRNPVYHSALKYQYDINNAKLSHKVQGGYSQRNWLLTELSNDIDSVSKSTRGMFFEFENEYLLKDSNFRLVLGARYVDPNFRSSGAQTRRIDFGAEYQNTVYPFYTNDYLIRPSNVFDLLSDENRYNQDLSTTLMGFNPIYSNILPYGDATPNRMGIYFSSRLNKNKIFSSNINAAYYSEVIGQGTSQKRNFTLLSGDLKININKILKTSKEISLSFSYWNELTRRNGDTLIQLNLNSSHLNGFVDFEFSKKFFVQFGIKQLSAKGKEFISQRNEYGEIENFLFANYDQQDYMYFTGLNYKIQKNIYANIQYNWWGTLVPNQSTLDFNYNRLLFIFSVKL